MSCTLCQDLKNKFNKEQGHSVTAERSAGVVIKKHEPRVNPEFEIKSQRNLLPNIGCNSIRAQEGVKLREGAGAQRA